VMASGFTSEIAERKRERSRLVFCMD
jgi:hypothetical protein